MTRFGLVHGAGLGAWCWDRLIGELEARGHQAVAVDLSLNEHHLELGQGEKRGHGR
jgi:hypothetical protein